MGSNNFMQGYVKYYFTIDDAFDKFNTRKLDVSRRALQRRYGKGISTKQICCRVFIYFLYLIILDIIRNNITFIFPTRKKLVLGIEIIRGKNLTEQLKARYPKMYDYLGAGMELPRIMFFFQKRDSELRSRGVMLNKSLTKEFFNNINAGKGYG